MTGEMPAQDAGAIDLTDIGALRGLLRRHGVERTNKGLGQHLLISRKSLDAVVAAAEVSPDDNVLEVGAGTGVLTVELAKRARRVVAVEMDRVILPVLREIIGSFPNVEIIPRDLLTVRPEDVFGEEPYKFVANLPYYITAMILRHILEARNRPTRVVVMVQREVAERMTAMPGEMSLLGLSAQFYGTPRIVAQVPATAFYPPPKVDSAVVRLDLFPRPPLDEAARDLFFSLARAGFAEKRKQLHNSLERSLRLDPEQVMGWLAACGINPERRAQSLSLDEWVALTRAALADPPRPLPQETRRERHQRSRSSSVDALVASYVPVARNDDNQSEALYTTLRVEGAPIERRDPRHTLFIRQAPARKSPHRARETSRFHPGQAHVCFPKARCAPGVRSRGANRDRTRGVGVFPAAALCAASGQCLSDQ